MAPEALAALGPVAPKAIDAASKAKDAAIRFDWQRAAHIFRNIAGHVSPATAASRARYAELFKQVASNPENLRQDAVKAGIIPQEAADVGVRAFTWIARNGEQIWVTVRDGTIMDAGVNAGQAIR